MFVMKSSRSLFCIMRTLELRVVGLLAMAMYQISSYAFLNYMYKCPVMHASSQKYPAIGFETLFTSILFYISSTLKTTISWRPRD